MAASDTPLRRYASVVVVSREQRSVDLVALGEAQTVQTRDMSPEYHPLGNPGEMLRT
jgi:hypothetical protein